MITAAQEAQLRELLEWNTLAQEALDDEEPWGEDGSMHAFSQGHKYGAHNLVEEILSIIGSN